MEVIVNKIPRQALLEELNPRTFVRKVNFGNNEIYIVNCNNAPNTIQEIGRLREITFRKAGGGTGKSIDLDEFDYGINPYQQLLVWNSEDQEVVGAYRFMSCKDASIENGKVKLSSTELFDFSDDFIKNYLPYTIELGRSFIQPMYQPSLLNRKGMFSLDNLWDGLGAIIVDNPWMKYFYGKVTMYQNYNKNARNILLSFLKHYFPDIKKLVYPKTHLKIATLDKEFLQLINNKPYKDGHLLLNKYIKSFGEHVPPLINSYMSLSNKMMVFGSAHNDKFGQVEETAILIPIADIHVNKMERHVATYKK